MKVEGKRIGIKNKDRKRREKKNKAREGEKRREYLNRQGAGDRRKMRENE